MMTDFSSWKHENLVALAQTMSAENTKVKAQHEHLHADNERLVDDVARLRGDIKTLRDAWRLLVKEKYRDGVLAE